MKLACKTIQSQMKAKMLVRTTPSNQDVVVTEADWIPKLPKKRRKATTNLVSSSKRKRTSRCAAAGTPLQAIVESE